MAAGTYLAVISLACMSIITTIAGVALAIRFRESEVGISIGIGFSTGIMLLISFFELIPESVTEAGPLVAFATVGLGAFILFSLHLLIPHIHLIEEKNGVSVGVLKSAYLVVFGLILHDFPEGFAMANSYIASPSLGVLVAVAIALHNLPEEFAMAIPAVMSKSRGFLYGSACFSALAEPAGAILGLIAVDFLPALNPLFLAFAAGAMIFVSVHELIPMAKRYGNLLLFALGIVSSVMIYLALGAFIEF